MLNPTLAKRARRRLGITQRALAQLISVHQPTIARWEGSKAVPSALAAGLLRLIEVYGEGAAQVLAAQRQAEGKDVNLIREFLVTPEDVGDTSHDSDSWRSREREIRRRGLDPDDEGAWIY